MYQEAFSSATVKCALGAVAALSCLAAMLVPAEASARPPGRAVVALPSKACVVDGRLKLRIRVRRARAIRSVAVRMNGRRVRVLRGPRLRRVLVLRRIARPSVRVRLVARTRKGKRIRVARRYRRCAPAAAAPFHIPGCADDYRLGRDEHPGGEWRSFNHDLLNSRFQRYERKIGTHNAAALAPVWSVSVASAGGAGTVAGTPIVTAGCVFAATNGGSVLAVNADTGKVVWTTKLRDRVSSLAYDGGRIYANVGKQGGPQVAALDARTGRPDWIADVDSNKEAELTGSPTVYDGMVLVGVSNFSFDKDPTAYYNAGAFRGSLLFIDGATGRVLKRTHIISDEEFKRGISGGGIWSTPAVDRETGHAYVGTGNPTSAIEHPNTNAILKFDADRRRPTFGQIVASYKGTADDYNPGIGDLDFGASPNLFVAPDGRRMFGALQKSGEFHAVGRADARGAWKDTLHVPTNGGNASTAATGGGRIFVPTGQQQQQPEVLYALDAGTGAVRWATPGAGSSYGPATLANGVVYLSDKGVLRAVDAATGQPLLARPLAGDGSNAIAFEAGVAVARNTVYANGGAALIAYRPGGAPGGSGGGPSGPGPGAGVEGATIVASPAGTATGYLTRIVAVPKGAKASLLNLDLAQHDVVAKATGAGGEPLFRSGLASFGAPAPVEGVERMGGGSYDFFCSLHPSMTGTLVVGG